MNTTINLVPPQGMAALTENLKKHYTVQHTLSNLGFLSIGDFINDIVELHTSSYAGYILNGSGASQGKLLDAKNVYRQHVKTSYHFELDQYETAKLVYYILSNCDLFLAVNFKPIDARLYFESLNALKLVWHNILVQNIQSDMMFVRADSSPYINSVKHNDCLEEFIDATKKTE